MSGDHGLTTLWSRRDHLAAGHLVKPRGKNFDVCRWLRQMAWQRSQTLRQKGEEGKKSKKGMGSGDEVRLQIPIPRFPLPIFLLLPLAAFTEHFARSAVSRGSLF
jgi:hypothetical protein